MISRIVAVLEAATTGLPVAKRHGLVEMIAGHPSKHSGGGKYTPVIGDKWGSLSYWRQVEPVRGRIVQGVVGQEEESTASLRFVAVLDRSDEGVCSDLDDALSAVRNSLYNGSFAIRETLSAYRAQVAVNLVDTNSEQVQRAEGVTQITAPTKWRFIAIEVRVTVNAKVGCLPSCLDTVVPTVGAVPVGCVEVSRICADGEEGQVLMIVGGKPQWTTL